MTVWPCVFSVDESGRHRTATCTFSPLPACAKRSAATHTNPTVATMKSADETPVLGNVCILRVKFVSAQSRP